MSAEEREWRVRRIGITVGALMGFLAPGRHDGYSVAGMPADAVCRHILPDCEGSRTIVLLVESMTFDPVPEGQMPQWLELSLTIHYSDEVTG